MIGWLKSKLPDTPCKQWLFLRFDKKKERERKEKYLAEHLKCPNCGSDQFAETHTNAALGFRCDCGLEFNLMPQLRIFDITRDPKEL